MTERFKGIPHHPSDVGLYWAALRRSRKAALSAAEDFRNPRRSSVSMVGSMALVAATGLGAILGTGWAVDRLVNTMRPQQENEAKGAAAIVAGVGILGGDDIAGSRFLTDQPDKVDSLPPATRGEVFISSVIPERREDISDWKIFPGEGFTLRYPKKPGWIATPNSILYGSEDNEKILMEIWRTMINKDERAFAKYVQEQYDAHSLGGRRVSSMPWVRTGLAGEVLTYSDENGGEMRHFMYCVNGMVVNLVVRGDNPELNKILGSLEVATEEGTAITIQQSGWQWGK